MDSSIVSGVARLRVDSLGTAVAAAGALGTACSGLIESLKWTRLGEVGFHKMQRLIGTALQATLAAAYGPQFEELLRAQYREDWAHGLLSKTLRTGVRQGLCGANAIAIAKFLGNVQPEALEAAATKMSQCTTLTDVDRDAVARFECAADTRIESALSLAQDAYLGAVRISASVTAIVLAESAALCIYHWDQWIAGGWIMGLIVGTLAVPLAPVANEVTNALQATAKALRGTR